MSELNLQDPKHLTFYVALILAWPAIRYVIWPMLKHIVKETHNDYFYGVLHKRIEDVVYFYKRRTNKNSMCAPTLEDEVSRLLTDVETLKTKVATLEKITQPNERERR
jgi:hypothetical protein